MNSSNNKFLFVDVKNDFMRINYFNSFWFDKRKKQKLAKDGKSVVIWLMVGVHDF